MELSRRVLFEKQSPFGVYNTPDDVPEYLWDYAAKTINNNSYNQRIEIYIEIVLVPMINVYNFYIEPMLNNKFKLWLIKFMENFKLDCGLWSNYNNSEFIKHFTQELWSNYPLLYRRMLEN